MLFDYDTEKARFIIELMTGASLEDWHKNNMILKWLLSKRKNSAGKQNPKE